MKIQEWLDNRERELADCTSEARAISMLQLCPYVQDAMLSDLSFRKDDSEAGCKRRIQKCQKTMNELQWAFRKYESIATPGQVKLLNHALYRLYQTFSQMIENEKKKLALLEWRGR